MISFIVCRSTTRTLLTLLKSYFKDDKDENTLQPYGKGETNPDGNGNTNQSNEAEREKNVRTRSTVNVQNASQK